MADGSADGGGSADGQGAAPAASKSRFIAVKSDEGLSDWEQSAAGTAAMVSTKLMLYPLDTLKTRRQAHKGGNLASFRGMWTVTGLYRGVLPKLLLYTPYQALYMAVYVKVRTFLTSGDYLGGGPLTFVLSGVAAEVVGSSVRLPMEVAKLRLQLGLYNNSAHALREMMRTPSGIYRNFVPQTLLHDCAYSACAWLLFEETRQRLFAARGVAELPHHESLLLGTVSGATTALVTTPLDVLRVRYVSQMPGQEVGVLPLVRGVWQQEGAGAFLRGGGLRVLHLAPAHGLYFFMYEAIKVQIGRWHGLGPSGT